VGSRRRRRDFFEDLVVEIMVGYLDGCDEQTQTSAAFVLQTDAPDYFYD
jgi:hypothetical protein